MIRLNQSHVKLWEEPDFSGIGPNSPTSMRSRSRRASIWPILRPAGGGAAQPDLPRPVGSAAPLQGETPPTTAWEIELNGRALRGLRVVGRCRSGAHPGGAAALLQARTTCCACACRLRHACRRDPPLVDVVMFNRAEVDYPASGDLDATSRRVARRTRRRSCWYRGAAPQLFGSDGRRYLPARSAPGTGALPRPAPTPSCSRCCRARRASFAPARGVRDRMAHAGRRRRLPHRRAPRLLDAVRPLASSTARADSRSRCWTWTTCPRPVQSRHPHPQAIRNLVDQAWPLAGAAGRASCCWSATPASTSATRRSTA